MKGLVVFYNMVASVIEFVCLQRRNKHICRYSGCCLYSVVYILASALPRIFFPYMVGSIFDGWKYQLVIVGSIFDGCKYHF